LNFFSHDQQLTVQHTVKLSKQNVLLFLRQLENKVKI
jgi:hypothetical protein